MVDLEIFSTISIIPEYKLDISTNLVPLQVVDYTGELGIPARCHGDVVNGVDELRDRGLR